VKSASQITHLPLDSQSAINDGFVRLKPETAESLLDQRVEPEYPEAARRAHIQGSVVLETLINANGRVQQVSAVSGNPDLADAAMAAVRQWRYKPFTVDGKKVPIRTQVNVTFMQAQ
jgi:protein TonB